VGDVQSALGATVASKSLRHMVLLVVFVFDMWPARGALGVVVFFCGGPRAVGVDWRFVCASAYSCLLQQGELLQSAERRLVLILEQHFFVFITLLRILSLSLSSLHVS
jgi:hypothetical protein